MIGNYVALSTSFNLEFNTPLPFLDCEHCVSRNERNVQKKLNFQIQWTQIKLYFAQPTAWAVFIEGGLLLVSASGMRRFPRQGRQGESDFGGSWRN